MASTLNLYDRRVQGQITQTVEGQQFYFAHDLPLERYTILPKFIEILSMGNRYERKIAWVVIFACDTHPLLHPIQYNKKSLT